MRAVLLFVLGVAVAVGLVFAFSPVRGRALVDRAADWFRPVPTVAASTPAAAPSPPALAPSTVAPEWRRHDREALRAYEAGRFEDAAVAWAAAAAGAPPAEVMAIRGRGDRANVFRLMSDGVPLATDMDAAAAEVEYRRRLEALREPGAGAFLELADFAAAHGLRGHLAYLYEQAFERKHSGEEVQQRVTRIIRQKREARKEPPPREVLEAVIRELPTSEAAEMAREETGQRNGGGGISGTAPHGGAPGTKPEDAGKLAEAARLMRQGDSEYRQAIPGSTDVNVHRRAALDAYLRARDLYEEVDRLSGVQAHEPQIHDLNRNIAELRKDLPIGK